MSVMRYVVTGIKVLLIMLLFPIAYVLQEFAKLLLKIAQDGWKFLNYVVDEW